MPTNVSDIVLEAPAVDFAYAGGLAASVYNNGVSLDVTRRLAQRAFDPAANLPVTAYSGGNAVGYVGGAKNLANAAERSSIACDVEKGMLLGYIPARFYCGQLPGVILQEDLYMPREVNPSQAVTFSLGGTIQPQYANQGPPSAYYY